MMRSIKRLKIILSIFSILVITLLSLNTWYNCNEQHRTIINAHLEMEAIIIQEVAKTSKLWFLKRITNDNADIDEIEQEILKEFIEPIKLLENGDAWIYNRDYVIFDKSSDFPEQYIGKSMREIFEMQKEKGAYHYEELTKGVENATEGKGWYVWLPEKGKEIVAWTSFEFNGKTWTLGLSTPESEILDHAGFDLIVIEQVIYSSLIIVLLIIISAFIIRYHSRQEKLFIQVRNVNRVLTNLDKSKNNFIKNISHDFRNPLTIIFNLAELNLGKKDQKREDMEKDFYTIYKTSSIFISKINTLLDISKLEASKLELSISKINLASFISRLISYNKSILKYNEVSLLTVFSENKYDGFYTDSEKLERIINYILSNAISFLSFEKKNMSIELREEKSKAEILIKNHSSLIGKEYFEILSSNLEQKTNHWPFLYSYMTQLSEMIGVSIEIKNSETSKDSVFIITIDKNKFSADDMNTKEENEKYKPDERISGTEVLKQSDSSIMITDANRQNEFDKFKGIILIVDNEPIIKEIILRYLKEEGYKNFLTASDGDTAINLIKQYQPDLVITEYYMPNIDGEIFFEKAASYTNTTFLPFIFISSIADENIILDQKSRGAVDFLLKPIKREELVISVNINMKKSIDVLKLSEIDELTGVFNRRFLFKEFEKIIFNTSIHNCSFILLDLDHFKDVNDTFGHQAGDYVLKSIGLEIIKIIRKQDIAGRYGGEEFGIILPGTNSNNAFIVAEKIRTAIEKLELVYSGKKIKITLSAGVSSFAQCINKFDRDKKDNRCIKRMIKMADIALYYAKMSKCCSCKHIPGADMEIKGNKCPNCGKETMSDRNRVEIYNNQMEPFNK